jgi:urocanate hydratase
MQSWGSLTYARSLLTDRCRIWPIPYVKGFIRGSWSVGNQPFRWKGDSLATADLDKSKEIKESAIVRHTGSTIVIEIIPNSRV